MKNILTWIEEKKQKHEGREPRTLLAEYKPGDDEMEQTEVLRPKRIDIFGNVIPAETLETWEPNPFLKPHAEGGRIGYDDGGFLDEALADYNTYLDMRKRRRKKFKVIPFKRFFELYSKENRAEGGRIGLQHGQLVRNTVDGSRPGYATSTVKKGKFKYPITNQHGTIYSDKKPKKYTHEVGSGKFNMAERNRVTRIKFPEYNSYSDLLKKDPAKAKNVMATLQHSSIRGTKITKKTIFTPLTEIQQNKILLEFPDAVFSKGQKFGFNSVSDQTKFVQVKKFIKRGYKPRFKQLPLKVKNELKEKFSHFKDWDFKKFKYGVPDTLNNVENRRLMQKVKTYINDPKPWKFGFSLEQKGAWMTAQMYRAWEHGNTDYEPIYNKNNKVIGMKEGGKTFYANENVAPSKKATLINSHSEFNNIQKFVDVANEAKLPLKDLKGYKNTKALLALFPEGYEKIKFSDLTNYLYKEAGADATRNAIEKHHLKSLSDIGSATDARNLQLLRQDLNTLGNTVAEQIKQGDFSRVADLEKAGVKITVDGTTYGKGFQDPRRQLGSLIGETTKKIKSLNKKDMNILLKELQSFCGYGKSTGGRIGFKTGSCSPEVAKRNFLIATNDVSTGRVTGEAAEQIVKNAGKVVAKAGSKSALMSILGPAGIGIDIAYEVGSIGLDVAYGGKSWNRALQDNWLTGAFIPGTSQEEFHKELYAKDSKAKPYGQALDLIDAYNKKQKQIERMKAATSYRGKAEAERWLPELERDLRGIEAQYNALTKHGKIMEEGSNEYENYMAAKTEFEDAAKAKSYGSAASLAYELEARESDRFKPREISPVKIDFKLPENYTTFKADLPTTEDINKIWQAQGFEGKVPTDLAKEFITGEKWRQLFEQPGIRGSQDWRGADGGLTRTVAPDSGPMSQGLRSLYINDKDY